MKVLRLPKSIRNQNSLCSLELLNRFLLTQLNATIWDSAEWVGSTWTNPSPLPLRHVSSGVEDHTCLTFWWICSYGDLSSSLLNPTLSAAKHFYLSAVSRLSRMPSSHFHSADWQQNDWHSALRQRPDFYEWVVKPTDRAGISAPPFMFVCLWKGRRADEEGGAH